MTSTPPVAHVEPERFTRGRSITEAVRWDGTPEHAQAIIRWMESDPERGDIPEAESAYWIDHEVDRDRYSMGFRSFDITRYALAGDWVMRANAGVYSPSPDPMFRALYTAADEHEPTAPGRERFSPAVGAAGFVGVVATLGNFGALWYAWEHFPAPIMGAVSLSSAFNGLCILGMSAIIHYCQKRVTR